MEQYITGTGNRDNPNTATIQPKQTLFESLAFLPCNKTVADNFTIAWSKINSPIYHKILATISGGSDSDVVLDILARCDKSHKVEYVWCNTGLEYQATQDHLDELEKKYGIEIKRIRPKWPIPSAVKKFGQPFLSKSPVSEYMSRLQKHGFKWEDKPYDELIKEYPKCQSALRWWTNSHDSDQFNIRRNKLLKEFIISNPPTFQISAQCCQKSKKSIIHELMDTGEYDLNVYGVRKAEGGVRATAYKSCFNCSSQGDYDEYRPLYWYKNEDKEDYCEALNITHSKCYSTYGLPRTGCAGCPFGKNFELELEVMKKYEPKLYAAATTIFKDSYEYTRKYRQFVKEHSNPNPQTVVEEHSVPKPQTVVAEHQDPKPQIAPEITANTEFRQLTIFDVFPTLTNVS